MNVANITAMVTNQGLTSGRSDAAAMAAARRAGGDESGGADVVADTCGSGTSVGLSNKRGGDAGHSEGRGTRGEEAGLRP